MQAETGHNDRKQGLCQIKSLISIQHVACPTMYTCVLDKKEHLVVCDSFLKYGLSSFIELNISNKKHFEKLLQTITTTQIHLHFFLKPLNYLKYEFSFFS